MARRNCSAADSRVLEPHELNYVYNPTDELNHLMDPPGVSEEELAEETALWTNRTRRAPSLQLRISFVKSLMKDHVISEWPFFLNEETGEFGRQDPLRRHDANSPL